MVIGEWIFLITFFKVFKDALHKKNVRELIKNSKRNTILFHVPQKILYSHLYLNLKTSITKGIKYSLNVRIV